MKVLFVLGTRPELIKLAPLIHQFSANSSFRSRVCVSGQHHTMVNSLLKVFGINPDYDLQVMRENQSLSSLSSRILLGVESVFSEYRPDFIFVHGDTTTSFIAALAAFYNGVEVFHVEAGLRTHNLKGPFPEEANRQLTARVASLHFAPTTQNMESLISEGIVRDAIFVTGNTGIDTLKWMVKRLRDDIGLRQEYLTELGRVYGSPLGARPYVLITGHRRENFGEGFNRIFEAILALAKKYPNIDFVYPVHLNPAVKDHATSFLSNANNVHLLPPLSYPVFVLLMSEAICLITDSGGIQEEAPSIGKPVLVTREETERVEALSSGMVRLVGTNINAIVDVAAEIIDADQCERDLLFGPIDTFGNGKSAQLIERIVSTRYL